MSIGGGIQPSGGSGGGTSGLPAGGTAADVLTGDGAWTDRAVVLDGMVNDVGAGNLRGAIDVYSKAEVDGLVPAAPPAVTSITFTDTGSSKQFRIDVQTRVGGVLQPCVMTHLRLSYLPLDPVQFGLLAGLQQENLTPYFGGGDKAVSSYMRAVADLTGLMRVVFTGKTAGRVITAEAWSDAPQSAHVTATHTVPA